MVNVREFRANDYESVYELWKRCALTLKESDLWPEMQKKLKRDPDLFLVAERDGRIIGSVMGTWDGRRAWVYHLSVDPGCQRQGIGSKLMAELERRFAKKGALKINFHIETHNLGVKEFYEKLGYYVQDDVVMMTKILSKRKS